MKLKMQNALVIRDGARKSSFLYLFMFWLLRDVLEIIMDQFRAIKSHTRQK